MATPKIASAACGTSLPFIFSNNVSIVDASTTNANNQFLLNCALAVDNTQIGSAGIYASQIIPTTVGRATFGGTIGYTFPAGLTIAGFTTAGVVTNSSTGALATTPVLPVANGGTGSATQNFVDLTTAQTIAGTKTLSSSLLLSGDASTTICLSGVSGALYIFNSSSCSTRMAYLDTSGNLTLYGSISPNSVQQTGSAYSNQFLGATTFGNTVTFNNGASIINGQAIINNNTHPGYYPYDNFGANANEHIERGVAAASPSGSAVVFRTPYTTSTSYVCTTTPDFAASTTVTTSVARNTASQITFFATSSINVEYICIGN